MTCVTRVRTGISILLPGHEAVYRQLPPLRFFSAFVPRRLTCSGPRQRLDRLRKNSINEGYGLHRLRKNSGPGRKDVLQGLNHECPPHGQLFGTAYATFFTESRRHLARGAQLKPAIRGSPTYPQSFTARLKSCPDTKQSFSAARHPSGAGGKCAH